MNYWGLVAFIGVILAFIVGGGLSGAWAVLHLLDTGRRWPLAVVAGSVLAIAVFGVPLISLLPRPTY